MSYLSALTSSVSDAAGDAGARGNEPLAMSRLISNLIEAMASPSSVTGISPPPAPPLPCSTFDGWSQASSSPPQHPIGTMSREYSQHKDDTSSGSPGTSSCASAVCGRCERSPTARCLECNEIYCHECSHAPAAECQLLEHTLVPVLQISPIGARPRSSSYDRDAFCELHADVVRYYCEPCVSLICEECTLWMHKDHNYTPVRGAQDSCRLNMLKAIESAKAGSKAIKGAIDRAVAISKGYEKETTDVSIRIKKAMRCFTQAIEDREKYLLDKVEKMRQDKLNELSDQMNSLRGILAGLAHTNETLVKCLEFEGINLFIANNKAMAQIENFASMYKSMQPKDDNIIFLPPNYDLVEQLKRQCDVLPASAGLSGYHQSMASAQPAAASYSMSASSSAALADYSRHSSGVSYYEGGHGAPAASLELGGQQRRLGQAIPGYWSSVVAKPPRNPVSGVPMLSFGREGHEEGRVSRPWGLCVDREGNIIVADRRNNRIQLFTGRGEFKSMFGSKGTGAGEFDLPAGITTDQYGRIIVVDKDNHRVQIFTNTGLFIVKFGSFGKECGQFQYPWDVAVNTLGQIAVTDTRNHRIQMFTSDGTYVTKFVFEGANPAKMLKGPTTPRGICFSSSGNVIVSDFENHRLIVLDAALSKVVHGAGREGAGAGELNRPSGIVVDDEGRVIVADSKNHRVLVLSAELRFLWAVDLRSPGLDDKDRPSDVALAPDGRLVVLFETLPDTARDLAPHAKEYIKVY